METFLIDYALPILGVIFLFGIAILVHEFGHFLFAKLSGVAVDKFAIGMGPKIIARRYRETEYSLRWIPFGGFVTLRGMFSKETEAYIHEGEPEKAQKEEDKSEEKEKEEGAKSLGQMAAEDIMPLRDKPLPIRWLIFGSGCLFNYITAIIVLGLVYAIGFPAPAPLPSSVGWVKDGSPLHEAGLRAMDRFVEINGDAVETWDDAYGVMDDIMDAESEEQLQAVVERDGQRIELTLPPVYPKEAFQSAYDGSVLMVLAPAYVEEVEPTQPADRAGLRAGDYIVMVESQPTPYFHDLCNVVRPGVGQPLLFRIRRGEEEFDKVIIPESNPHKPTQGWIGIYQGNPDKEFVREPVHVAYLRAPGRTVAYTMFILVTLKDMFARFNVDELKQQLGGPIAIGILGYREAKKGLVRYLRFLVMFNIILFVINMLPIPVLDGGHILISTVETILRRPMPPRVLVSLFTFFALALITLAILLTYNDFMRWILKLY